MADGGEGTLKVIKYYDHNAMVIEHQVKGPLDTDVKASMIYIPSTEEIFIEMAETSGMMLLNKQDRNPYYTSTYGVGQLVLHALNHHPKRIVIALGGSVTNDGGAGFLSALGVSFLDCMNKPVKLGGKYLRSISSIQNRESLDRFKDIEFLVLSDVRNILLGDRGATHTFGEQKGANFDMRQDLELGMTHFADLMEKTFDKNIRMIPGTGAAGGLGFALNFLPHITIRSGIDYLLQFSGIEKDIMDCDYVFIGEGSLDNQSLEGKVPVGISRLSKKYDKKVIALVGTLKCSEASLRPFGIDEVYTINEEIDYLPNLLKEARKNTKATAEKVARKIKETIK
jgi:glycerate kinase